MDELHGIGTSYILYTNICCPTGKLTFHKKIYVNNCINTSENTDEVISVLNYCFLVHW